MKKTTISYIALIVLLTLTSVLSLKLFFRQRSDHDVVDIRTFPHTIGDWQGRDLEITQMEYNILETRNMISREYANPTKEKLYLFIVYSETNRSVFHPPEVCMMGGGIIIKDKKSEKINADKFEFSTNKLYFERNNLEYITLYSYKAGNLYTDNFYLQQLYFAFNQFFGKQRGGATIRVSMPMHGNEEETVAILKKFMKETIEILEKLS